MSERITISPITRLEGHGKIDIFLDEAGKVRDCYLQVVELRGFEKFCQGRPVEELPRITPKICGVCPGAHHMASSKAADEVYGVRIPPIAEKLRRLFYNAHIAHSHILHFYALAAPDFIPGAEAGPEKRNILGLIQAVGREEGREVLAHRGYAQKIQGMLAGHPIHPVSSLPGGMSKPLQEQERAEIEPMADSLVQFARKSLRLFEDLILSRKSSREMISGDTYYSRTYYMGLVDDRGCVDFYDGTARVASPDGSLFASFDPRDYLEHIGEHVEPWTYLKFPFLKSVGWKGLVDGGDSGIYRVNSLARLNVADGMATPLAQQEYEKLFDFFGGKPVHHTMAYHWARLIENLQACEELARLIRDPEITGEDIRTLPGKPVGEGVGAVEAARGTLFHHYKTDSQGMVQQANLIVATVQNNAAMNLSVKRAAERLIENGSPDEAILDRVEMAFRAYDPCLACATHHLPGKTPLEVRLVRPDGVVRTLSRGPEGEG
ncbi:MAG: Ni/Fe hydrogenase subunit alpha [Desulfohalobiaceae bacterium]|nr:Ni/Fe hydrogenase subunit alpha [Desulfohalobiaceae bacterium]